MKRCTLLLIPLLAALTTRAQSLPATGATPAAFVPAGYRVLPGGRVSGDLNGDGRPDVALALGPQAEQAANLSEAPPPRLLLVLWRQAAGGYRLAVTARQVLYCRHCSGSPDDFEPFDCLDIAQGTLRVQQHGGYRRPWTLEDQFAYRQQRLVLVRETSRSRQPGPTCPAHGYPPACYLRDTNFVTGEYERVNVSEGCELLSHKQGRQPPEPLRLLAYYKPGT